MRAGRVVACITVVMWLLIVLIHCCLSDRNDKLDAILVVN